ncbi:MAG: DUF1150 domain-containing protein [Alphaproteobacteria bacterium]|nr:DUF1150 domain-containing protein [Alphaproteobacteria bacterium]
MTSNPVESGKIQLIDMTQNDLRELGMEEVGYVRKYSVKGKPAWVLHAADGTALAVQENMPALQASLQHHDLDIVSVH